MRALRTAYTHLDERGRDAHAGQGHSLQTLLVDDEVAHWEEGRKEDALIRTTYCTQDTYLVRVQVKNSDVLTQEVQVARRYLVSTPRPPPTSTTITR